MNFNIKRYLNENKNINRIYHIFDKFKIAFCQVFIISNGIIIFTNNIQYLIQKASAVDYTQRFKKQVNDISRIDKT